LREREWFQERAEGWEVTVRGRNTRSKIERVTNVLNAQPFIALDDEPRAAMLDAMQRFPHTN
jgi:hypothetical protein